MKVREVIKRLEQEGWRHVRSVGSHRTFKKTGVASIVTVSGSDGKDVLIGQLHDIKRKAGWK